MLFQRKGRELSNSDAKKLCAHHVNPSTPMSPSFAREHYVAFKTPTCPPTVPNVPILFSRKNSPTNNEHSMIDIQIIVITTFITAVTHYATRVVMKAIRFGTHADSVAVALEAITIISAHHVLPSMKRPA